MYKGLWFNLSTQNDQQHSREVLLRVRKQESGTLGTRGFFFACDQEPRRPKAEDTGGGSLSFRLQLTDTGNYAWKASGTRGTKVVA